MPSAPTSSSAMPPAEVLAPTEKPRLHNGYLTDLHCLARGLPPRYVPPLNASRSRRQVGRILQFLANRRPLPVKDRHCLMHLLQTLNPRPEPYRTAQGQRDLLRLRPETLAALDSPVFTPASRFPCGPEAGRGTEGIACHCHVLDLQVGGGRRGGRGRASGLWNGFSALPPGVLIFWVRKAREGPEKRSQSIRVSGCLVCFSSCGVLDELNTAGLQACPTFCKAFVPLCRGHKFPSWGTEDKESLLGGIAARASPGLISPCGVFSTSSIPDPSVAISLRAVADTGYLESGHHWFSLPPGRQPTGLLCSPVSLHLCRHWAAKGQRCPFYMTCTRRYFPILPLALLGFLLLWLGSVNKGGEAPRSEPRVASTAQASAGQGSTTPLEGRSTSLGRDHPSTASRINAAKTAFAEGQWQKQAKDGAAASVNCGVRVAIKHGNRVAVDLIKSNTRPVGDNHLHSRFYDCRTTRTTTDKCDEQVVKAFDWQREGQSRLGYSIGCLV